MMIAHPHRWLQCICAVAVFGAHFAWTDAAMPATTTVYPTGSFPLDMQNVQVAIDRGGTVILKATNAAGQPTPFDFGPPDPQVDGGVNLHTEPIQARMQPGAGLLAHHGSGHLTAQQDDVEVGMLLGDLGRGLDAGQPAAGHHDGPVGEPVKVVREQRRVLRAVQGVGELVDTRPLVGPAFGPDFATAAAPAGNADQRVAASPAATSAAMARLKWGRSLTVMDSTSRAGEWMEIGHR